MPSNDKHQGNFCCLLRKSKATSRWPIFTLWLRFFFFQNSYPTWCLLIWRGGLCEFLPTPWCFCAVVMQNQVQGSTKKQTHTEIWGTTVTSQWSSDVFVSAIRTNKRKIVTALHICIEMGIKGLVFWRHGSPPDACRHGELTHSFVWFEAPTDQAAAAPCCFSHKEYLPSLTIPFSSGGAAAALPLKHQSVNLNYIKWQK